MPDRMAEIRARLAAATPGPWGTGYNADSWFVVKDSFGDDVVPVQIDLPNTDLIAHAPADIAWLLDEVERLHQYADHTELCDINTCRGSGYAYACTCGLSNEYVKGISDA